MAYVLAPLVGILTRFVPRGIAIAIIVLLMIGLVSGIGAVIIPKMITEVSELVNRLPGYGNAMFNMYNQVIRWIENLGLALPIEEIRQWIIKRLPELGQIFADQTTLALKSLSSGLAALLNLFMIPFVAYYLLKDFEKIIAIFKQLLPPRHASVIWDFMTQINNVLGQYVRGQMLVSSFIAVLTTIGLALSGIRYAVLLGIMAGIFNLVPYVGLAVSLGVSAFVALLDANGLDAVVKVVVVFVIVQGIEGNFLSPKVVGERVGLHPVWVMVALVVSAHFFGVIGMVVAIPVAAVTNIVLKIITDRYVQSHYYGQLPDG
jgi:predicted PurR-regulated permease PerM